MRARALGWLVVAASVMAIAVAVGQRFVSPVLFVAGAIMLVVGVALAFGVAADLADEQGGTLEEWRERHWNREA